MAHRARPRSTRATTSAVVPSKSDVLAPTQVLVRVRRSACRQPPNVLRTEEFFGPIPLPVSGNHETVRTPERSTGRKIGAENSIRVAFSLGRIDEQLSANTGSSPLSR